MPTSGLDRKSRVRGVGHAKLLAVPVLVAALALAACGSSSSGGSSSGGSGGNFVLGTVQPLTGAYGAVGVDIVNALKAEADILNKSGGISGHKIQVVVTDDASDAQRAVSATQQMVQTKKLNMFEPDVVLGNTQLPLVKNILSIDLCGQPICADGKKYPLTFTANPSAATQVPPLAKWAAQHHYTKVAILAQDDPDGHSFADASQAALKANNIAVSGTQFFDSSATDITPQVQKLKGTGGQAVFSWAVGTTVGVVMKGMQTTGWKAPVIGTPAVFTAPPSQVVPSSVQSQLLCMCYASQVRSGATVTGSLATLVAAMQKYGKPNALATSALAADTLEMANYAYGKAGSLDPKKAAKALQNIGTDAKYPASKFYAFSDVNPDFHGVQHAPNDAKLGNGFFALAKVSPVVDGTYEGTLFKF